MVTVVLRPTISWPGVIFAILTQGGVNVAWVISTLAVAVLLVRLVSGLSPMTTLVLVWVPAALGVVTRVIVTVAPGAGQWPAVAPVVGEVMCTVNDDAAWGVPAGTVTGPQVSTPNAIAQVLFQPAPCEAIDQDRPALVGSVSDRTTPCASPLPV